MIRIVPVIAAAALLLGCAPAADNGLRQDLKKEAALHGLAIVQISSDQVGVVRWSPEGRFVMLTEPVTPIPLIGSQYQLWVGRVSDGALAAIRKFGGIAGDYDAYHWIVDYRKFCSRCKPGRSFY